jgi:hypothetical protein
VTFCFLGTIVQHELYVTEMNVDRTYRRRQQMDERREKAVESSNGLTRAWTALR